MNFEPMYDGAACSLARKSFGNLVEHSLDFLWIFQHRKIAGRASRGCCAQLLSVCHAPWPAVNHLRCAEAYRPNSLLKIRFQPKQTYCPGAWRSKKRPTHESFISSE